LCQISSQMELEFAATLAPTLQVFITKTDQQVQTPVVASAPFVPVEEHCSEPEVPAPVRDHRLTARLAIVQKKLESPTLPAFRREKLMNQKSKIEEAILRSPVVQAPKQQEMAFVEDPEQQTRKCRGRKNLSDRLIAIDQALSNPNLPPKRMERLQQQKSKLEALNSEVAPVVVSQAPKAVPLVPLRCAEAPKVIPLVPLRGPAARLNAIEKILAQPNLKPHRLEKLQEKKSKLEEIISEREAKNSPAPAVLPPAPQVVALVPLRGARGPEARLAAITKMMESTDLPAHRLQKLMNQKSMIEQRILDRADFSEKKCGRGRRDQNLDCQQKPRGARLVVKRK